MQIQIEGEWLDMSDSDISLHWTAFRFSEVLTDTFSNDFDLPLTAKNMRLLGLYSVLSRQGDPFADMLPCWLTMQGEGGDGMLSVNGIHDGVVSVTVYMSAIPDVLRQVATRLVVDNDDTIMDFTNRSLETSSSRIQPCNYTTYNSANGGNIMHPNVKLSYLLSQLSTVTGKTLPTVSDNYRLLATRQVVCPQAAKQALYLRWGVGSHEWVTTGQHITNEVDSNNLSVVMNRNASVLMTVYTLTAVVTPSPVVELQARANGGSWNHVATLNTMASATTPAVTTVGTSFAAGTEWRIMATDWNGEVFIGCDWRTYTVTDDDYSVPLNFDLSANYTLPTWVNMSISYVYFGVLANLPTFTVRELLSSLAWMLGQRVTVTPWEIQLTAANIEKEIAAEITAIDFDSGSIGRVTKVESAKGDTLGSVTIANDKLQDSKTLHKSIFALLKGVGVDNIVELDLYSEQDGKWKAVDYDGGVALAWAVEHTSGYIYLQPVEGWTLDGFAQLSRVCEVQAVTRESVSGCDYVTIDGHRYMLIEGDSDEQSGLTTFKALII